MLGSRPGAGPSNRATGYDDLSLLSDTEVGPWPHIADPLAYLRERRQSQSDSDASSETEDDGPTDLSVPKIREDHMDVGESDNDIQVIYDSNVDHHTDSGGTRKVSDVSDKSANNTHGQNMNDRCQYHHCVPLPNSKRVIMVPSKVPYQPPSVVMFGEDGETLAVIHTVVVPPLIGSFAYPSGLVEPSMEPLSHVQDLAVNDGFSDVSDEEETERKRQPKIVELPLDNEQNSDNSVAAVRRIHEPPSEEPQPGPSGVVIKSKSGVKKEPWNHNRLIRFIYSHAFSLPHHIWMPRLEGVPRRSARIAEKLKAKRYFLRPRSLPKRG